MSHVKAAIENSDPRFAPSPTLGMDETEQAKSAQWDAIYEMICEEADKIEREEGCWHVEGRYFADHEDAAMQRMYCAERRVRERIRAQKQTLNASFVPKELRGK